MDEIEIKFTPQERDLIIDHTFADPELTKRLTIAEIRGKYLDEETQLMMLNYRPVYIDETIRPGDRLALFPKEYPFFVDWDDYRNR